MSSLVKRLVFFGGIIILIGVTQLLPSKAQVPLILVLVLVLSVSVLYLIITDYMRERKSRGEEKTITREDIYRVIAEKVWRWRTKGTNRNN